MWLKVKPRERTVYAILLICILESENMKISGGINAARKITDLVGHIIGLH